MRQLIVKLDNLINMKIHWTKLDGCTQNSEFPAGILIPIGGAEDRTCDKSILQHVVSETGLNYPRICVITSASKIPDKIRSIYSTAFTAIGITELDFIHFGSRSEADTDVNMAVASRCDAVLFTGGDQLRLSWFLQRSNLLDLLLIRYRQESGFVIAGTSAGAAALSQRMISSGQGLAPLVKGNVELSDGLAFVENIIIDTHFAERGRFERLIESVAGHSELLGLGLGENTAVVLRNGTTLEVIGNGAIAVVDGRRIRYNNMRQVGRGKPFTLSALKLHILGPGSIYKISNRHFHSPKKKEEVVMTSI